jgi:hypothetical protein
VLKVLREHRPEPSVKLQDVCPRTLRNWLRR